MTCKRCGAATARLTTDQRYCDPCAREVAARYGPTGTVPGTLPTAPFVRRALRHELPAADYTGRIVR